MSENNEDILIVIPARAGSKGIKNKNMLTLGMGTNLLDIAIAQGKEIGGRVVVTSDSEKYCRSAREQQVETIERRSFLATDEASTYATVLDAVTRMRINETFVAVLQPTNPFRMLQHIKYHLPKFKADYESGMAVRHVGGFLHNENDMEPEHRTWNYRPRRQDWGLGRVEDTGEFFICRIDKLAAHNDLVWQGCYPFFGTGICDIDNETDYTMACRLWKPEFICGVDHP